MVRKLAALGVALAVAVAACTASDTGGERGSPAESGDDVLVRLREGGLTIVIRHAATDRSQPDATVVDLDDCATQRNLSEQGRTDARAIGEAVDRLAIPVGAVWASPYCRSRDTADLAFGRVEVVPGLEQLYPERDEQADTRLNQLIRDQAPHPGEPNLIITSHGVYPSVLAPAVTPGEGEAVLYARTDGGFELVDRIEPNEWATLGADRLGTGAARVADSVVTLDGPNGVGTAFRVAVPGILVTSARLVANTAEVTLVAADGSRRTARVLGRDPDIDIAALRITDDTGLPPLHSGTALADARVGDPVFAVGAAGTVTGGPLRELATVDISGRAAVIRIDAEVPGNSVGGPLVNEDGYVLGVLTTGGVAIPVDAAREAALEIVRHS